MMSDGVSRLLREPLIHFVVAGAVLFGGYTVLNRGTSAPEKAPPQIRITAGDVTWLAENWTRQWRRPPTRDELRGLVTDHVNEQLLAREARAIGLEDNDVIVRRRLSQKLAFIIEDTSRRAEPMDDELQKFYQAHRERFRTDARISFTHVYVDPARRADAMADAADMLKALLAEGVEAGNQDVGDRSLIDARFEGETEQAISAVFGPDFARVVFSLKSGLWSGPIRSGYGLHLVLVSDLRASELPSLPKIRDRVAQEWRRDQEQHAKEAYLSALRKKYNIVADDGLASLLVAPANEATAQ